MMAGVLQVGTSVREVFHNSQPVQMSYAATNEFFCTSACTITMPS